jgi:fluoroquinolone transport system permease protein
MNDRQSLSRIRNALLSDIVFQYKQGFYFIYLLISFVYLLILSQLPLEYANIALPVIVFSDPSVLGLFFIGGILLLEKEQGIIQTLSVTPLKTHEYMISKLISLCLISMMAVLLITFLSSASEVNYVLLLVGVIMTSVFFTLIGIMIATKSRHLNAFFVKMIPWMIVLVAPCALIVLFPDEWILSVFPSIASLRMVYGAYNGISNLEVFVSGGVMIVSNLLLFGKAKAMFEKHMIYGGR